MAIHNITTTEVLAIKEAIELAVEELRAAGDESDWSVTNGADEMLGQAMDILISVLRTDGVSYD